MKKPLTLLSLTLLLLPLCLFGQEGATIKGRVTDDVGNPLPGANVFIQDTQYGAATDTEGAFSFSLPAEIAGGQEVVVTAQFIGYLSRSERMTIFPSVAATSEEPIYSVTVACGRMALSATQTLTAII